MIGQLHTGYAVKFDPESGAGPVNMGSVVRQGLRIGNQVVQVPTSGEAFARFIALYGQKFSVMWEVLDLKTCLDACGVLGTYVTSTIKTGVTLYAQKISEGGTRTAGATHDSWNIKEGYAYPSAITCEHQGDARLSYDLLPTWDGTNNPIVIAKDVALPSPITDALRYTIGPITLGGIVFDQVRRVSIGFGIAAQTEGADSDIWDGFSFVQSVIPSIRIDGVKKRWLDSTAIPLTGLLCTHANSSIIFRKRAIGGTFVLPATAEHVKFTFAGLAVVPTIFESEGNAPGTVSIEIPISWDGTNNPLVANTASAY